MKHPARWNARRIAMLAACAACAVCVLWLDWSVEDAFMNGITVLVVTATVLMAVSSVVPSPAEGDEWELGKLPSKISHWRKLRKEYNSER